MGMYEVRPRLNGEDMTPEQVYDYCVAHSEVRHWQSDMFVKRNPDVDIIFDAAWHHGDVGEFYGWFVVYNSYMPWYDMMKRNKGWCDDGSLPRFRGDAIMDGSFYDPIKDALVGVDNG